MAQYINIEELAKQLYSTYIYCIYEIGSDGIFKAFLNFPKSPPLWQDIDNTDREFWMKIANDVDYDIKNR